MENITASGIGIIDFRSMKIHAPRMTNELCNKWLGNRLLKIYYFEAVASDDSFETEGFIIMFHDQIYIIDNAFGYIMNYIPSADNIKEAYLVSKFNWPNDNIRASRVGLVSDFLHDWFDLETEAYLENPKNCTDMEQEISHILKIKYLFAHPDFRLNEEIGGKVDNVIFYGWLINQQEYSASTKCLNPDWYENNQVQLSEELKVDLTEIETMLKHDQVDDQMETAQIYYGGNSNEFKKFAKDIPMMDASGSSEDTVRVYKEFDLAATEWDIDYVYSFRYGLGSYLMKLKTTVLGRVECLLMVLHGTQWESVQLNDLLLDIKSDCKKDKAALIETYKKEIMNFIDFFEVI